MVGDIVGPADGAEVAAKLGVKDGVDEGAAVGDIVGPADGAELGAREGLDVPIKDGGPKEDGLLRLGGCCSPGVGMTVFSGHEGANVDGFLDFFVADSVGFLVGFLVGFETGESVGAT